MIPHELIFAVHGSQCHASTLVALSGGRFLAAWFEGRQEGDSTCAIRFSFRETDGHWSAPETLAKISFVAHWNPVLFQAPSTGELMLFFKVGKQISCWRTYVMRSLDEGRHWSTPVELVPGDASGGRGPVKNPPIRNDFDAIVAPGSYEINGHWRAFTDLSTDGGYTWHRSPDVPMPSEPIDAPLCNNQLRLIQPTLWESTPGQLHMLLRSNNCHIYRSDSQDGGETWCQAYPTTLPNNNSGICLARFPDGTLLLAANPHSSHWGGERYTIALLASQDNGKSWSPPFIVETSQQPELSPGVRVEYSYPTILALPDGDSFAMTYTWNRQSIAFVTGSRQEILALK